jgi:hypothetical protein
MCSWVFGLLGQPAVADDIVDPLLDLRCKRPTLSRRELAHVDRGKSSRHDRTDVAHALAQRLVGEPLLALVEPQLLHRRGVTVIRMRSGRQRASREACETNDEQGRCKPPFDIILDLLKRQSLRPNSSCRDLRLTALTADC